MKQIIESYSSFTNNKGRAMYEEKIENFSAKYGKYELILRLNDIFTEGVKFTYALSGGSKPVNGIVTISGEVGDLSFEMDNDAKVKEYNRVLPDLFTQIEKDNNFTDLF